MDVTLVEATKLLDNIMTNYSQWHTERAPTGKKVNSVEEITTLSEKVDALMNMVASKNSHVDTASTYDIINEYNRRFEKYTISKSSP